MQRFLLGSLDMPGVTRGCACGMQATLSHLVAGQVEVEKVKPSHSQDSGDMSGAEEFRMQVALLPMRLRLDKHVITFLQAFIAPQDPNYADFEAVDAATVPTAGATVDSAGLPSHC